MKIAQEQERADYGKLTDSALARSRQRLGVPRPPRIAPNLEVSLDTSRHFAFGYGDDNPLYCDLDYAAGTRWGGLIAPPNFHYTMGEDAAPERDAETRALLKGDPLAGLGSYQAVMEYEWWQPLRLGDRCKVLQAQVGVVEKASRFGGRTAHLTHAFIYANGRGGLHAVRRGTWVHAERSATKERKTETLVQRPYTVEDLARIDAAYEAETRRGAKPRYFEDVVVGDAIQPRVKGPLTTTDVVVWHMGWGMQLTPPGAFKIAYDIRKKIPGMYPANNLNIPDTVQRLHWEPERAQELGLPTSYDYGAMRETWIIHALTDWMGDDAWLWKLRCEHRKFNYIGDTTWIYGRVTAKERIDGHNAVHLEVWCENQHGVVTTPATATVLLPTHDAPVDLPEPPATTLDGVLQSELERFNIESQS